MPIDKKAKAKAGVQSAMGVSPDLQASSTDRMLGEMLDEGPSKVSEQEAYEYALKTYKAKLKRRGANDPSTKEWAAKVKLLQPKAGGSGSTGAGGGNTEKGEPEVVWPTNVDGTY